MRSKIAVVLFFCFLLTLCTPVQAEPAAGPGAEPAAGPGAESVAATGSNAEPGGVIEHSEPEEVIEYEEPEGLVDLFPKFEWTEEDRFLLSFRVVNGSNVIIPETEVVLRLSGPEGNTEGVSFEGSVRAEPEDYPGTAVIADEQKVLRVLLTDIAPGSEYVFSAEGTAGEEITVPAVQAALILRGYGQEHATESGIEVPERAPVEEPVEEITVLLAVRLLENGKTAVSVPYVVLPEYGADIYMEKDKEAADRRMHFLPLTQEKGSRSIPLPFLVLCVTAVMTAVYSVLNHLLVKRAVSIKEKRDPGLLKNYKK